MSVELPKDCSICLSPVNDGWTHPGGEQHPFHLECIKEWVQVNPTCPCDRQPIDPNQLFSRTERVAAEVKRTGSRAACAGGLYAASAGVGALVAGFPGMVVMSIATGLRIGNRAALEEAEERSDNAEQAAVDAEADAEMAARTAREQRTLEAEAFANEAIGRADAFAALANYEDERLERCEAGIQNVERISTLGTAAAGIWSGSFMGFATFGVLNYLSKEFSADVLERVYPLSSDRRIIGGSCGLGGLAAICISAAYPEIGTVASFAIGGLVCTAGAVFASLRRQ